MPNINDFATAISIRLTDEWDGAKDFANDAEKLKEVLEKLLSSNPEECRKLIGTGIIEDSYFDDL